MKGFKPTGNGPRSGFSFPSKGGFGPSSGRVKSVAGYSRRAPKRRAIGGLVKDNIVETPGGPADFSKGGTVQNLGRAVKKYASEMRKPKEKYGGLKPLGKLTPENNEMLARRLRKGD